MIRLFVLSCAFVALLSSSSHAQQIPEVPSAAIADSLKVKATFDSRFEAMKAFVTPEGVKNRGLRANGKIDSIGFEFFIDGKKDTLKGVDYTATTTDSAFRIISNIMETLEMSVLNKDALESRLYSEAWKFRDDTRVVAKYGDASKPTVSYVHLLFFSSDGAKSYAAKVPLDFAGRIGMEIPILYQIWK